MTQKVTFCPVDTWTPSVNLYQLADRIEVCIELAGVDPKQIDVRLEPGRLIVMGHRPTPEPQREAGAGMTIIAMEIDHGQFCRTIALPENVDIRRADSEYRGGMLWVRLPLKLRR
jgi:HSP20 family protein